MGLKHSDTSARDHSPRGKAHRTSLHKSSSLQSSSPAQSALGTVQQGTQSEKRIGSPQVTGWTAINQSDIQCGSVASFATLQRSARPNQYTFQEKKLRTLAPAPTIVSRPPRAPAPRPLLPREDIFIDENGRHKVRIQRHSPLKDSYDPAVAVADPITAPPPEQQPSNIPTTCSEPLPLNFDPSQCVWHALRDVAFVKDGHIQLSMEDLCALLRFRYAGMDARMNGVDESHVLAMREFVGERGKEMYDVRRWFMRKDMEADLKSIREGGESRTSWEA